MPDSIYPLSSRVQGGSTRTTQGYKRYVLICLTLVYTVNFVDRGLIGLLLQPIKEDLRLSDTQLGFLTGIAFGLFYATLGLPIARWADRGNRVTITSVALALWSGTVMLCLFVTNFAQLVAARVAAAVGEAGCFPTTYSLVGDYFPAPAERTRAMAIYMLGNPLSAILSFVAGGWLNSRYGWRTTFCLMGLPALFIAVVIRLTITEPRQSASPADPRTIRQPRMLDVLKTLWCRRATRHLSVAIILLCTMALGLAPWYAAFLTRSHDIGTQELGIWLGIAFGVGGAVGTLLGGYGSARWFGDDARSQMRLSAVMIALVVPCFVVFLLVPQKMGALVALVPLQAVIVFFVGPTLALMQQLVPDEMRATTLAVVMLLANLIGMGIGPQVIGIGSDVLEPYVGRDSLRYSMLGMSLVALWAAYHFWMVGKTVNEELPRKPSYG